MHANRSFVPQQLKSIAMGDFDFSHDKRVKDADT